MKILGYTVVASLVFCLYFIIQKHLALMNSDQFPGTVIGHIPHKGGKGTTYGLNVEYVDATGEKIVFEASGSSRPPPRPIGAKVLVFQHRDRSKPDILVFASTYLGLWLWLSVGLAVAGCLAAPALLDAIYRR